MARSHSIASFRPAGFALLKPASKPQLDTARIITMSGTFYRFTLEAQQTKLPVPSTKHLRQKITKLARLLRFRR